MLGSATPRLGLRRDITLFLLSLAAFFVCIIAVLVVALQMAVARAEESARQHWNLAADAVAERLLSADIRNEQTADTMLVWARSRFGVSAIELKQGDRILRSGITSPELARLQRDVAGSSLTLWFDDTALDAHRRTFYSIAVIALISAFLTTIVVLMYVPKIVGPIEALLVQARRVSEDTELPADEGDYVIRAFRETIEKLELREQELRDLHEREKTRADELERISATLTRSLSSGFLSVTPDGRIAELNVAGAQILGIESPTEVLGREVATAIPPPLSSVISNSLRESAAYPRMELRQGAVDLGLTTVPLRDAAGSALGLLVLFTNLTPIHELEGRVRALQALADLGEMAAGVAHEFRNSLSTISGYLKLARRHGSPPEVDTKLAAAESESARLSAAVTALLNFARPFDLDVVEVDLAEIVTAVASPLQDTSGATLHLDLQTAEIEGDATLLARAVENGIRNALDAVQDRDGGEVFIEVRATPEPCIVIRDNGVGLDPAAVPRLFLPFQSDRPGGFGLGLSLIKKIVLLHGGVVELNGSPGTGAALRMSFPRRRVEEEGRSSGADVLPFVPTGFD